MTSTTRRSELIKNILLSLFSVVVTIFILEIGVRVFAPVPLVASDLFLVTERLPEVQARTARRALKPNVQIRHTAAEYDVNVRINNKGLRDVERGYSKPPNTTRLLFLGDSFTFGYGVEENQRFTNLVEAQLNKNSAQKNGPRYEIINAGVPSWGTTDELLYLQEEGLKYKPDIVVVCFYENDVRDNYERDLFTLHNGRLVAKRRLTALTTQQKQPARPSYLTRDPLGDQVLNITATDSSTMRQPQVNFLLASSHLARLVRVTVLTRKPTAITEQSIVENRAATQELTVSLLNEVRRVSESAGASFKLVVIPHKKDRKLGRTDPLQKYPTLYAWSKKQPSGQVLNLLKATSATPDPESLYFNKDRHLNAAGHAVVAKMIAEFLQSKRNAP